MEKIYMNRLEEVREMLGITQGQFAAKLGISKSAYNNFAYGYRDMKSAFVKKVCILAQCNPSWLLCADAVAAPTASVTTRDENFIIETYRNLNERGQNFMLESIKHISNAPEYKKDISDKKVAI